MDTFCLQDWVTVRGAVGTIVVQSEPAWLDLRGYRELVTWFDIREASSPAATPLACQTGVAKEESLFANMVTFGTAVNPLVNGITTTLVTPELAQATSTTPLARWVRWSVTFNGAGTTDVSFRIWIAANKPGRASVNRAAAIKR